MEQDLGYLFVKNMFNYYHQILKFLLIHKKEKEQLSLLRSMKI